MNRLLVVGEDALCCAIGQRLAQCVLPHWTLAGLPVDTRGVSKLRQSVDRYAEQARYVQPVLCIADTDRQCPVTWMQELSRKNWPSSFILRLAVSEAESWLLADRTGFAQFLGLSIAKLSADPESLPDAKREVLRLARISKVRHLRQEMVSVIDPAKPASGYNVHLRGFVLSTWNPERAARVSTSLRRAMRRLLELATAE